MLTPLPGFCARVAELVAAHPPAAARQASAGRRPDDARAAGAAAQDLRAEDVFLALGAWLPADATVVEESPSTRQQLQDMLPARSPLGFLSAAMGGLGFAMPAAMGLKLACPERPVVAVLGDGSSLYSCQSLWSAQHYGAGVLYVVLSNGGYAIMDRLAAQAGGRAPWPSFGDIDIAGVARSLGCPALTVTTHDELARALDGTIPPLASLDQPLLMNVVVAR